MEKLTPEQFLQLLEDAGIADELRLDPREDFVAETAYLYEWAAEVGTDNYEITGVGSSCEDGIMSFIVEFTHATGEEVTFIYAPDPQLPGKHSLLILRDDVAVYARRAAQDPLTDWDINCMAGDPEVTDADGNMLFDGEPTNI